MAKKHKKPVIGAYFERIAAETKAREEREANTVFHANFRIGETVTACAMTDGQLDTSKPLPFLKPCPPREMRVLAAISWACSRAPGRLIHVGAICEATEMKLYEVLALLLVLEVRYLVKQYPGKTFVLDDKLKDVLFTLPGPPMSEGEPAEVVMKRLAEKGNAK